MLLTEALMTSQSERVRKVQSTLKSLRAFVIDDEMEKMQRHADEKVVCFSRPSTPSRLFFAQALQRLLCPQVNVATAALTTATPAFLQYSLRQSSFNNDSGSNSNESSPACARRECCLVVDSPAPTLLSIALQVCHRSSIQWCWYCCCCCCWWWWWRRRRRLCLWHVCVGSLGCPCCLILLYATAYDN
jgi:hypothetical protein